MHFYLFSIAKNIWIHPLCCLNMNAINSFFMEEDIKISVLIPMSLVMIIFSKAF